MITHVLLSHAHETILLTVEEKEIDMDSARKLRISALLDHVNRDSSILAKQIPLT